MQESLLADAEEVLMTIEKIDPSEIPGRSTKAAGPQTEEGLAIAALALGEAIQYPCRWNHSVIGRMCAGSSYARFAAAPAGIRIKTRCHEGTFYVHRVA